MKKKELVSVIIPTYNRAHLIGETLDSVLAQTYQNWECIVVDDGSSDNTDKVVGEYVKKDIRFKYYHRPEYHLPGGNGARNYGFKMSQGEYVNWFDSDDLMMPEKLELKVKAMEENDVDFVVCCGALIDSYFNVMEKWDNICSKSPLKSHITGHVTFSTNGPLFKKKILVDKKGFCERLKRKQEWEFFSRILSYTENYSPVKKTLYYIKRTDDSINVKNDVKSINSKVLANILVYKQVKRKRKDIIDTDFRHHFFRKSMYCLIVSKKVSEYKALLYSIHGILLVLDFGLTKRIIKNILKHK